LLVPGPAGGAVVKAVPATQRRHDPRLRVRLPVNLWDGTEWRRYTSGDVSLRGLYLETMEPLAVGTLVKLGLLLVDTQERVTIQGHVRHLLTPDQAERRPAGMGVKFDPTTPEARRRWRQFIRWLIQNYPQSDRLVVDFSGRRSSTRLAPVVDKVGPAAGPPPATVPPQAPRPVLRTVDGFELSRDVAPAATQQRLRKLERRYQVALLGLVLSAGVHVAAGFDGADAAALGVAACEVPFALEGMECVAAVGDGFLVQTATGQPLASTAGLDAAAAQAGFKVQHEADGLYALNHIDSANQEASHDKD